MSKRNPVKIPVYPDGTIPHYYHTHYDRQHGGPPEWREPEAFRAILELQGFSRGRSATNWDFKSETGANYTVFMVDFERMVKHPQWSRGKITSLFIAQKRGSNYGIRLATEEDLMKMQAQGKKLP